MASARSGDAPPTAGSEGAYACGTPSDPLPTRPSTAGGTIDAWSGTPFGAAECGTNDGEDAPRFNTLCGDCGTALAPGAIVPGSCGPLPKGPNDEPAGSTFTGAGTPPKAVAEGATFKAACGSARSPGKAAKNSPASLAKTPTSRGLCTSLVGVWILMELANLNIFQHSQRIVRLHHQRAIQADQVRRNRAAVDAHEAH